MSNNAHKPASEVINNFMELTKCHRVYLYGGAAIDRFMNPECKIMDYDIAIKDLEEYQHAIEKLREQGFEIGTPRISFNLSTVAKHPEHGIFDLSCMDIEKNGIYNFEKFYIEYSPAHPRGRAVDRFKTVRALREGRIEIINNPDEEKAYDLLRRFNVLAGKYVFSLDRDGINKDTIETIERRLKETPINKSTEHSRVRCLSRFLGAAFRSRPQDEYFAGIGKTNLMSYGYPQINKLINNQEFIESLKQKPAKDKIDLIEKMLEYSEHRELFIEEISLLSKREPDREDARVINKVNELSNEKTSLQHLDSAIISPIFNHIMSARKEK